MASSLLNADQQVGSSIGLAVPGTVARTVVANSVHAQTAHASAANTQPSGPARPRPGDVHHDLPPCPGHRIPAPSSGRDHPARPYHHDRRGPGCRAPTHRQHEPSGNPAEPMTAVYPPSAPGATRPDPEGPAQQAAVAVTAPPRPSAPAGAARPRATAPFPQRRRAGAVGIRGLAVGGSGVRRAGKLGRDHQPALPTARSGARFAPVRSALAAWPGMCTGTSGRRVRAARR
jgi:hypothetical protein